ncbi:uncharacterized protein LOC106176254 [Lingula anatina]|uniref:Uncharacterized protein LOC106176254 n=1 Tax=Lingula anatina TaxID=7574 RepID=A0A1S3JV91_LINAN|nr:uncharacterized protein LOC106176254 [Lingula anatina]|eukprot:XP_013414019.1 uncharacterized protein LOC106176254 [Lingula anatina]
MNSFENAISQRRKILSDLTLKIQEVEQQHLDGIHEYEEKLDQLAEKFSKAKNYFTKKSLEKELQKTKQAYSVHIESIQVLNSDIENLTKSVEDLELQCEALDEIEQRFLVDFPKEFQKDIINMFKDEESLAHEETLKLQKDLDAATAELDEYKEKDLEINTPAA